jgi:hypothetical protein
MNLIDGKALTEELAIKQFFLCIPDSTNSQPLLTRFAFAEFLLRIATVKYGSDTA